MNLPKSKEHLADWLHQQSDQFNRPDFIANDPIRIPHSFTRLQDIEIMAFWTSMLAWGRRATIINKAEELVDLMDGEPYAFILGHEPKDRDRFLDFKHRTFQPTDTLYFLTWLQSYYRQYDSLETAFSRHLDENAPHVEAALRGFHNDFFALPEAPTRTRKHIATPARKSRCKRMNMFLRWMVRRDDRGVDFGLWKTIQPAQLLMPLDVHVERVARELGLLQRKQNDWKAVLELTDAVRRFDENDPVKFDFALFGSGVG